MPVHLGPCWHPCLQQMGFPRGLAIALFIFPDWGYLALKSFGGILALLPEVNVSLKHHNTASWCVCSQLNPVLFLTLLKLQHD